MAERYSIVQTRLEYERSRRRLTRTARPLDFGVPVLIRRFAPAHGHVPKLPKRCAVLNGILFERNDSAERSSYTVSGIQEIKTIFISLHKRHSPYLSRTCVPENRSLRRNKFIDCRTFSQIFDGTDCEQPITSE